VWGFKRGDTDYRLSLLPLGGYVKMAGESLNYDSDKPGDAWEFGSKPIWQRIWVVAAGPLMNILTAFLILSVLFMVGIEVPVYPLKVGLVNPDSPAAKSGFMVGDEILKIDGAEVSDWEEINRRINLSIGNELIFTLRRDGEVTDKPVLPQLDPQIGVGTIGIGQFIEARIGDVAKGKPADLAGLKRGDLVLSINGEEIKSWWQLSDMIHSLPGVETVLKIQRGDDDFEVKITPELESRLNVGLIGIYPTIQTRIQRYDPARAIFEGTKRGIYLIRDTVISVGMIIQGRLSARSLGGPIMIAQMSGQFASAGRRDFFTFLAVISISLGIFNLFPIPVLDGGRILFLLIEKIKGSPVSLRWREFSLQIGVILLILLMVFVTINDVLRVIR
jgi:regulator of sigma E protease